MREPFGVAHLRRFTLEHVDEVPADDLALLFRIADAAQGREKLPGGVDVHHLHAHVLGERIHHLRGFVQAQEPMVDEDAGELLADRAVDERGGHRGIDAAREAEDDFLATDLRL